MPRIPFLALIGNKPLSFGVELLGRFRNTLQTSQDCIPRHIVG